MFPIYRNFYISARQPAHNDGCGPLPNKAGSPCFKA